MEHGYKLTDAVQKREISGQSVTLKENCNCEASFALSVIHYI